MPHAPVGVPPSAPVFPGAPQDAASPQACSSTSLPGGGGFGAVVAQNLCEAVLTPEFFEKHWEKWPLHHRAAEHGNDANRLPEALDVDAVMALLRCAGSSLKTFKSGDPFDGSNFLIAYLEGASMIVNQADRYNQTLMELSRALARRHFLHVFSVAYLTPPGSQAVRMHTDDQDVFLLQVWGRKQWMIRNNPKKLPYTEEMLGKDTPVPEELVEDPIMEFTMEPHDVLYIPRGFLHEASTQEESSLHVTVTVPTSDYCWGVQLVKHLIGQMHSDDMPDYVQAASRRSLCGAKSAAPSEEEFQDILKSWLGGLTMDSVLEAFEQRMERTNGGQDRAFSHNMEQQRRLRPWISEDGRVRLMTGVTCWCEPDSEMAIFTREADGLRLELGISRSAAPIVRSLTSKPQCVRDLPGADPFGRACVLQLLHQHEVVQLFLDSPGPPMPQPAPPRP